MCDSFVDRPAAGSGRAARPAEPTAAKGATARGWFDRQPMAQAFEPRPSLGGRSTVSHRRKEHFCFPILKNSEIVQCLNELGLDVTEDTLARCRADSLHGVYEHLLIDCLDVSKEDLHQPKFYGLDALKHAELHEDSVPAMHFVRAM